MRHLALVVCALCWFVQASWAAETDRDRLLADFRNEFLELKPGTPPFPTQFTMGRDGGPAAEAPAHPVRVERPFAIARYEVTQNLWQAVTGKNPSRWKGPRNAVEMLSYSEAVEFCQAMTRLLLEAKLIQADEEVRLPTEAEWEYAARAGTNTLYSFGDDAEQLGEFAWSTHNAAGNDPPVGAKRANAWGLHDGHGYLWEWCADPWHDTYSGAPGDMSVWMGGDKNRRVLRGGSWKDPAERLTSTYRRPAAIDLKDDAVGLRPVLAKRAK
ncbi:MAG TPA: formylglycine-generating enzyme family protein [Pirellulales bacterium]|jgi:formylglycine-generating enzyme required for sulfatase activity